MVDTELQKLIKEIRETCGISKNNKEFNEHIAKYAFNYMLRRKEVTEYIKIAIDVFSVLAPQLMSSSGMGGTLGAISTSLATSPTASTLPDIIDSKVDWFWDNLDNADLDGEVY